MSSLDAKVPVLFLPVGIETRFIDFPDGHSELWVRVFPDQIAINSFEPELTQREIDDGNAYWNAVSGAGNPPPLEALKAAWRGLASRYGAERAAWIARQLTPTNPPQPPCAPTPVVVRTSSWEKAAIADALPDAWTVVTVSGTETTRFTGSPIAPNLHVGLDPHGGAFPPGSPVDPEMKWLVDFDTALQKGMALTISPLTPEQRASGFDRIFVYGLRAQDSSGSDTFAHLLDALHYSVGVALVADGAPTKTTPDASSAYSSKDPDYDISFAIERQDALTNDPAADGNAFAALVGIDPCHMAHIGDPWHMANVGHADNTSVRNGTDMLTALWPTLGYFLTQMMVNMAGGYEIGPPKRAIAVATSPDMESVRQYVLTNVNPRGPISAFRVGRTPYGVLPITSLRRYNPSGEGPGRLGERALVRLLLCLWPKWLASAANAPHMQRTGDPDKELLHVLGMDASSMTFRGREGLGNEFFWNYMHFIGMPFTAMNAWWADHLERSRQLLDSCGLKDWDPRVVHLAMTKPSFPISLPTVQAGPLSETGGLKAGALLPDGTTGNYIQWLKQASVEDIRTENYRNPPAATSGTSPTKPTALLYKILRQSMILEYANLATAVEITQGRLQPSQAREAEIIGVQARQPSAIESQPAPVSVWEVLARPALPYSQDTWQNYLVNLVPTPDSPFAELNDLRASLDRLAALPTAELDRLLTETLDACSHRLDVWATAVATAILKRTRAPGLHLGCFGWLEDVRPAAERPAVQGAELRQVRLMDEQRAKTLNTSANLPPPLEPLQDNGGFIIAPSLAQAAVAAVLRNGYMTHKGTSEEGLLSIDLSSERVRKALWLLDGVRQGQSLNALLGYLFESGLHDGLHDLQLDKYTQPFRDCFPIVADKLIPPNDPSESVESVAASNVVDGLALRTAWHNGQLAAGDDWAIAQGHGVECAGLPGPDQPDDQDAVIGLLKKLDDYADALGDLSMSEAVFQVMRGNFGRAGGLMDAVSKGQGLPDPEVISTPRGGLDLTHRVALLFAGDPPANAWSNVTQRPRATAEPWLDSWLSRLLPDPALNSIFCEVNYHDTQGDHTPSVNLSDLKLGPLDCLAMADAATEVPQASELEYRILYAAGVTPTADPKSVRINYQPTPPPSISFPDMFFLCKALRSLINAARPLRPQDLTVPEKKAQDLGGAVDLKGLLSRASDLVQKLQTDLGELNGPTTTSLPEALRECSFYGIPGSVPYSNDANDPRLSAQVAAVAKTLNDRLTTAQATGSF